MLVDFTFVDLKHGGKYDYVRSCRTSAIPRVGDVVSLPGLEGGGPLWNHEDHKQATRVAEFAEVENVVWIPSETDEGPDEEMEIEIYCVISWETTT